MCLFRYDPNVVCSLIEQSKDLPAWGIKSLKKKKKKILKAFGNIQTWRTPSCAPPPTYDFLLFLLFSFTRFLSITHFSTSNLIISFHHSIQSPSLLLSVSSSPWILFIFLVNSTSRSVTLCLTFSHFQSSVQTQFTDHLINTDSFLSFMAVCVCVWGGGEKMRCDGQESINEVCVPVQT